MILIWKAVVLGVGVQAHPKSFNLLKIWAASLKIRVKIAPNIVWLQKMARKVCRKTPEDLFGGHTKKGLDDLCGRECVGKICTKSFSETFGETRAKNHSQPPKFAYSSTYDEKSPQLLPFWNDRGINPCLHFPASLCTLFCTHSL